MSLFKILKGDSSRISTTVTPFHDGYAYFTPDDGKFYIDVETGGVQKRININSGGKSTAVYAILQADGWNDGQQSVAVSELSENQNGIVGVAQDISDEALRAARDAGLYVCGQADGSITIACKNEVPKIDIPIVVLLLK